MVLRMLQPSFTGGEISPSLQARVDAASYHTWLKSAQNMLVHPQGGISNRSGTQFVGAAKYADKPCQLVAFPISAAEGYMLEWGEKYVRFFTSSGPILQADGTPLELATPYAASDVSALRTAQYNHQLYVAHGNYPLHVLTRTAAGVFTLEEAPVRYGPFMPANTDEAKQLRLYPQTTTVESEGVPASLAFSPVNDTGRMVWAYFDGTCFYASETYGLNTSAIVSNFNAAYSAQGLTAYNQGGVFTITSSAADGGTWNGKVFLLEYRSRFTGAADYTVTQTLSGGENAGTQTVAQPGRYILESNFACFTPRHVGGRFCLVHTVAASYQSGTLGHESTSARIVSAGDWTLRTRGTWTGPLTVEVSKDGGATWHTYQVLSRASGEDNFYLSGHVPEAEEMLSVRVRSGALSGEAAYELTSESFIQRGVVQVIRYISATQVVVTQERQCGSQDWTSVWAEGSFSPSAGYPSCVFFYQDRLGLAATQQEGQTLWFSKTGNFSDFGRARDTLLATDALSVRLGGTQLNRIQAVVVAAKLLIFTTGSEWTLTPNGALALDTLELAQQSQRGSYSTAPVQVGNRVLFVQARGGVLRDFGYDYATSSYSGEDLTLRAKHLFEGRTLTQLVYTQEPDSLVWCVTQEGALLSLTYVPEQNIYAWTHHHTQGTFGSLCALADQLWLTVQRAGGVFIEHLIPREPQTDPVSGVFLDASVSVQFAEPSTQVTGLTHLEGQSVTALADGNVVQGLTVQAGTVELPYAATRVHVGLSYQAQLHTLPIARVLTQQRKYRYVSVCVPVYRSRGGKMGTGEEVFTELVQRELEAYNQPIDLKTQTYTMLLAASHTTSPGVVIQQAEPLPLTVLGIGLTAV